MMNRALKARLFSIIFLVNVLLGVDFVCATPNALSLVQQQAQQLKLANDAQWQALLHYHNQRSLVADKAFFFHPDGAEDKQAELEATLAAFFQTTSDDDNSPQCRFPARFAWLQQHLKLPIPTHRCEKLQNWLKNLAVTSISLVFPVAYLNNPASMFGHSFLRLDSTESQLMAWTVNYAAETEQQQGVAFALKGLFGGYQGQFTLAPYYVLLKEYADLESRDMWEYRLNFSFPEQQRLLLHLWEVQSAHFDYYFINKNCSFQVLALLEVARPSLNLTEQFQWDAIPADTVRAVMTVPNLLQTVHYRPALASQLVSQAQALNSAQQTLAKSLAQGTLLPDDATMQALPVVTQAQVLEVAFSYLSYLNASKIKHKQPLDGKLAYDLLTARSLLPKTAREEKTPIPLFRPDQGHAGNRLQLAGGYDGNAPYTQLGFRWSYHDLTDPAAGFVQGSEVEFFKPSLRYYPQQQRVQIEQFDFITINSMPSRTSFIQPFSWQVSLGMNRLRFPARERAVVGALKIGGGLSYEIDAQTLLSTAALGSLLVSDKFNQNTAVGLGGTVYAQHDFSTRWRGAVEATVQHYLQGITQTTYRYAFFQRVTLSANQAIVLKLGRGNEFDQAAFDAQLAWQFYF